MQVCTSNISGNDMCTIPFKDFSENHINIEKRSKFQELDFLGYTLPRT